MRSEEIYANLTKWLIYAAFIAMAAALVVRIAVDPQQVATQLEETFGGRLQEWRLSYSHDHWALYAIYFTNLVAAAGLVAALPALSRENKAAAAVAAFLVALLLLAALKVV
jgi:hypothetical protein